MVQNLTNLCRCKPNRRISLMMLRDKKAATENRAALRISFADSCSAQGGLSYKIKKRVRCQKVTNSFFEP